MTALLNIIFDDLGIRLLVFRFEFSCLYIPQEHCLKKNLFCYEENNEYVNF